MYAAMMGGGSTGSNAFLIALALLELCAAGLGNTRRRVLMGLLLLLALASQVACNNSSGGGAGTASGVVHSMQTAMEVDAIKQVNHDPVSVVGLPAAMGMVSVSVK